MHLLKERDYGFEVVDITVPASSDAVGKSIDQLELPEGVILALVIRQNRTPLRPQGSTVIETGDQIIAVTHPDRELALRNVLTGK
jgi:trk system potassium uptake protein TrkA